MQVQKFMKTSVLTASPDTTVSEIFNLFYKKHLHSLPVVDRQKHMLGIISEEDLLERLFPGYEDGIEALLSDETDEELIEKLKKVKHKTAADVMVKRVYFARVDTLVMRALSRMIVRKIRQLPVLDDDDRLVGMISKADIFRGIFKLR